MFTKRILVPVVASVFLFSCVSSKSYKTLEAKNADLNTAYTKLQNDLKDCNDKNAEAARKQSSLENDMASLRKENAFLKENNTTVLNQLKDLSVISGTQAESVKKSLENIGAKTPISRICKPPWRVKILSIWHS
jgi:chemotaxis protein MotB